ncbi:hypothetical protein SKAU_G00188700 [Synaphobranchus kaupii]|uniref:Uncharacterized protein n=1 Tax=Synaphobranchus kaupii TaxID=118154 RepID=A0A9Q1FDA2_SYNKA|nr:hypothetical protein SKAU_G00188700 [Synaphobranchus kaupii]
MDLPLIWKGACPRVAGFLVPAHKSRRRGCSVHKVTRQTSLGRCRPSSASAPLQPPVPKALSLPELSLPELIKETGVARLTGLRMRSISTSSSAPPLPSPSFESDTDGPSRRRLAAAMRDIAPGRMVGTQ